MTILNRYLLRRNLFLLLMLIMTGAGIYVLSDLFQRIDVFIDAGYGFGFIALYYVIKLPMIISQILPAVFLLALVVQLSMMNKNRETIALQSGGVSPLATVKFILVYGIVWACCQFTFSQILGVTGEKIAADMWNEQVKGRDAYDFELNNLLFTQGKYVVHAESVFPSAEQAVNIHVYVLSDDGLSIESTHTAASASSSSKGWELSNVESIYPEAFTYKKSETMFLNIKQDLKTFKSYQPNTKVSEIEFSELKKMIDRLEQAGTNVESMRTDYYRRFAYAGSIITMGILALAISMRTQSVYAGVFLSLVCTFVFYAATTFFGTMGEAGTLKPAIAAWAANIVFIALGLIYIVSQYIKTITRKL
ncbi:LptF/LptG family permease [Desulfovibrio sp. OttesenSCG-928-F07]|nr:LptF/LptG family permease [Desulfovibrio sp. OttesenSCG-928-F07]